MLIIKLAVPLCIAMVFLASAAAAQPLPNTDPLTEQADFAVRMVDGVNAFFLRETEQMRARRESRWKRDVSSPDRYNASVEPNRGHLRAMIGAADSREAPHLELVAPLGPAIEQPGLVGVASHFKVYAVRWHAVRNVEGEGLLLQPNGTPVADIIALPDCDQTPEMLAGIAPGVPPASQFARRLAENGCRVIVPALLNRQVTHSGMDGVGSTNETHREFIYRAAYEMGHHIIGYEVEKTLAAIDWLQLTGGGEQAIKRPIGIIGYGEGGLIALYAAACDTRIGAAAVSGYFAPREGLWQEPIYRNVFGLLAEFGDAEIATLIAPRPLIVEAGKAPEIPGPPQTGRADAAPGRLTTPSLSQAKAELDRAAGLVSGLAGVKFELVGSGNSPAGSEACISSLLRSLGCRHDLAPAGKVRPAGARLDDAARTKRQFLQLADDTQRLMRESSDRRKEFWSGVDFSSPQKLQSSSAPYRARFRADLLGEIAPPTLPPSPKSRKVYDTPAFTGYEVKIDLYPDVFAYGILLVPKGIRAGEKRAVVVCQHGLEGRPQDVADPAVDNQYYHHFACSLAEQGYITFAPQNPYIGGDKFRLALRKAQPLGLTLWSVIVRQHERILQWLATLPQVDPGRIGFYGLSYGGKTAMRVPAALEGYCLSICSADYNEWVWKNASMHSPYSYLLWGEYDMPEFNLANTFNYAEMSWLICPRPFMVERGMMDGVAPDEWVAYEYARTRRVYELMGIGDRTELEVFNGPHTIHGKGTFEFLHRHLPAREAPK